MFDNLIRFSLTSCICSFMQCNLNFCIKNLGCQICLGSDNNGNRHSRYFFKLNITESLAKIKCFVEMFSEYIFDGI